MRRAGTAPTALLAGAWLVVSLGIAAAQTPPPPGDGFRLPVECALNQDCWIVNYFDAIAGPKEADFRCSSRTYDGHDGTDIAIRDLKAMSRGVPVIAGAPGVVAFTRDGEEDGIYVRQGPPATRGLDCGNALVIDYGNGWSAQFCHLRRDSVRVRNGERVEATTVLGLVGMSGKAEFPHLHWILRHGNINLDPFTGRPAAESCQATAPTRALWGAATGIRYEAFNLYAAGFAARQPQVADIVADAGGADTLPGSSARLGLWAAIYGVREGDRIALRVTGPSGSQLMRGQQTATRVRALQLLYLARPRSSDAPWPAGTYRGSVVIERQIDGLMVRQTREATVEVR